MNIEPGNVDARLATSGSFKDRIRRLPGVRWLRFTRRLAKDCGWVNAVFDADHYLADLRRRDPARTELLADIREGRA